MEVEARGIEGPIVGVAVGGFEITGGVKVGGVPEAATEVGEQGKLRPYLRDLTDEDRVLVNRAESVVESVVSALYGPSCFVYA